MRSLPIRIGLVGIVGIPSLQRLRRLALYQIAYGHGEYPVHLLRIARKRRHEFIRRRIGQVVVDRPHDGRDPRPVHGRDRPGPSQYRHERRTIGRPRFGRRFAPRRVVVVVALGGRAPAFRRQRVRRVARHPKQVRGPVLLPRRRPVLQGSAEAGLDHLLLRRALRRRRQAGRHSREHGHPQGEVSRGRRPQADARGGSGGVRRLVGGPGEGHRGHVVPGGRRQPQGEPIWRSARAVPFLRHRVRRRGPAGCDRGFFRDEQSRLPSLDAQIGGPRRRRRQRRRRRSVDRGEKQS
mmetsp:Transcript_12087/g.26178  ORF Transcript_12087/g.26178 Transcript_12087/m.26178 type:complete len:294 (-) Transcript_12087:956-1837(-)